MDSVLDGKDSSATSRGESSGRPEHIEILRNLYHNDYSKGFDDGRPETPYEQYLLGIRQYLPWVDHILRYMHPQMKQYRLATSPESTSILLAEFTAEGALNCHAVTDIEHISTTLRSTEEQQPLCRLIIAEDLSPRIIEYLGSSLQLDPRVFHEHLIQCEDMHHGKSGQFSRQFGDHLFPFFDTRNLLTNQEEFRTERGFACFKNTLSVSLPYDSFAAISDPGSFRKKNLGTLDIAQYSAYQDQPRCYLQSQRVPTSRAYNCQLPDNCRPLRFNSYKQITIHRVSNLQLTVPTYLIMWYGPSIPVCPGILSLRTASPLKLHEDCQIYASPDLGSPQDLLSPAYSNDQATFLQPLNLIFKDSANDSRHWIRSKAFLVNLCRDLHIHDLTPTILEHRLLKWLSGKSLTDFQTAVAMDCRAWDDMRKVLNRDGPRGYVYRPLLSSFRQSLYVKLVNLRRTQEHLNISRTLGKFPMSSSKTTIQDYDNQVQLLQWKQLSGSLEEIIQHIDVRLRNAEVSLQTLLANTQLEESRKAIQQGETVKRLTVLAFIYIPVSCASSIFGMNVREFMSPNPSIWKWVVVTLFMTTLTILASIQKLRAYFYELWLPFGQAARQLFVKNRYLWRNHMIRIKDWRRKTTRANFRSDQNTEPSHQL